MQDRTIKIEKSKAGQFQQNPRNPKKHPPKQLERLNAIFDKYGQIGVLIVYESKRKGGWTIFDGHARREYDPEQVWNVLYTDLTDEEVDTLSFMYDKVGEDSEPYLEVLEELLQESKAGFELAGNEVLNDFVFEIATEHNLSLDYLNDILSDDNEIEVPEPELDKGEELAKEYGVELGQTWVLDSGKGVKHLLACGDCTDEKVVEELMGGDKAQLMCFDPPYGVSYASKNRFLNQLGKGNHIQTRIQNDHLSVEDTAENLWKPAFSNAHNALANVSSFYCFMPQGGDQMMMMMMMNEAGLIPRHELMWLKNNHVLGRSDYCYKHEPIVYGWKRKGTHKFYGGFKTSVLEYPKPLRSELHPTMKPLELINELLTNSSQRGDIVIDFFLGSGTTLLSCEELSRNCVAIELYPNYVAVAIHRWEKLTGCKAKLLK